MTHKYRQEELTRPDLFHWLSKPNQIDASPIISRHSQSIISCSSLALYFSTQGSKQTLWSSHTDLRLRIPDEDVAPQQARRDIEIPEQMYDDWKQFKEYDALPMFSLYKENLEFTESNESLSSQFESLESFEMPTVKLKSIRRSSTVDTTETVIRNDAIINLSIVLCKSGPVFEYCNIANLQI